MRFSFLLNSRERPVLLRNFLQSIVNTASTMDGIEVHIGCDNDDLVTKLVQPQLERDFPFIRFHWRERERNLHSYLNQMFPYTTGKYIYGLNDDVELLTKNWDILVSDAIEEFVAKNGDRICHCNIGDDSFDKLNDEYGAFIVWTRESCEALGCVIPDDKFHYWGADVYICRIYREVDRVLDLKNIRMSHVLHRDGIQGDHLRKEMLPYFLAGPQDYQTCDISEEVNKLKLAIHFPTLME